MTDQKLINLPSGSPIQAGDLAYVSRSVGGTPTDYQVAIGTLAGKSTVGNGDMTNSSVTVNAGTGLTGGGTVSLGSAITINADQDISTTGTPQFARIGLGQAPDATAVMQAAGQYNSVEHDNGNVTGTATINWNNGNVQYVTMTGATTFTFTNPKAGGRYLLHVAGAFSPTWPASVRWPGGVTPTPTAAAGKKDIYTFVYSGKESLYDGAQNANYATT